mmetsp:Transcript_10775/g.33932  ORF Transcript_10775/g.33932 Transcript_10775/m.33932 type:complete len:111 (-) Transcript_10775:85-417(-)
MSARRRVPAGAATSCGAVPVEQELWPYTRAAVGTLCIRDAPTDVGVGVGRPGPYAWGEICTCAPRHEGGRGGHALILLPAVFFLPLIWPGVGRRRFRSIVHPVISDPMRC